MKTILLISPYWKEEHRWMVSSFKLAELWQRLGYRVVVACMGPETSTEVVSPTLTIYRKKDLFLPDPWNYGIAFGFTSLVRRIIKEEKPDVIACNKILFWTSFSVIPLSLSGHKIILLTDALVGMTWWGRTLLFRLASRIYAWTAGWLILLCADQLITFHPEPERLMKFLGVSRKWKIIPTGIDPAPYTRNDQLPMTNDHVTVTYVGRLESVKGVDDFLAAAEMVKKEHPEVKFQVAGLAPEDHPLRQKHATTAEFLGLREDVAEILKKTDIFVMPSYSEGLSNALMEAMSSSCACIATDVGGNPFLLQNGVSGFLFYPGDREALAAHIRRLIGDPAKRVMLGQNARKRIEQMFSWEKVGEAYKKLFEDATAESSGKTRVVIFSAFLSPFRSGAEACAEEVAIRLASDFDVTIVTAKLRSDLPRVSQLKHNVNVVRVGLGLPIDKWLYPFLAPFAARRVRPQVIHAILETFAGLALLLSKYLVPAKRLLTLQTTNRRFLRGPIIRSADQVTAISTALVDDAKTLGAKDVTVIPNGADVAAIAAASRSHPKISGRILFAGRLEQMKGIDTLLRAVASIKDQQWSLHIVGDGSQKATLESLVQELQISDRVTFLGYLQQEDLWKEYAEAEIFCGLSRSEALGNVFIEAQAAGCAVIATNVGGIPEVVIDSKTGVLVAPDDAVAAAEHIRRLRGSLSERNRLAAAAKEHAMAYSWDGIAKKYGGLWRIS